MLDADVRIFRVIGAIPGVHFDLVATRRRMGASYLRRVLVEE